ncbi:MAG: hypothetical protein H6828_09000 [Planctomycetes bacterium]|nr:hypothetical protein [Planctomycetota bacterium]
MSNLRASLLVLAAALLPLACTAETHSSAAPGVTVGTPTGTAEVHRVECGCSEDTGVGHCGNYIEVDGAWHPVGGDLGLGHMEWCGQHGLKAEVTGTLVGDEYVATSLKVLPKE